MQVQMLVAPSLSGAVASPPGPITLVVTVLRAEGLRGFWLGQTGTLFRETGGTAFWFGTRELVSTWLVSRHPSQSEAVNPKKDLKPWESALSGAFAGAAFNISLFPADTVKSAMQTGEELHGGTRSGDVPWKKLSFWRTFADIWKAQGVKGLYAGMGVTIARSIPSSAMIFLIYDTLDNHFG